MLKTNKTYRAEIVKTNLVIEYLYSNDMYELLKDLLFVVENNDIKNLKITEQYRNKVLLSSYNPSENKQIVQIVDAQEKCIQLKTKFEKTGNKWKQVEEQEVSILTEKQYDLTTEEKTLKFFRQLGGKEKLSKNYTRKGYNVVELVSISPDKDEKIVYQFDYSLEKMEVLVKNLINEIIKNLK